MNTTYVNFSFSDGCKIENPILRGMTPMWEIYLNPHMSVEERLHHLIESQKLILEGLEALEHKIALERKSLEK